MTEQSQLCPSQDGAVMLDIGGDIGALIILTAQDLRLAEIEVSLVDDKAAATPIEAHDHGHTHDDGSTHHHAHPHRTHVAVRERLGPAGTRYAAIYPGLREGEYTVWDLQGQPAETVRIVGGEITEIDWR